MYFRYQTSSLDFSTGIYQPSYPAAAGLTLHSYSTQKPNYTITTRNYGTTNYNIASEGIKKTDRDTIYNFWNTTLAQGYNTFSIIDQRDRILFESSWPNWRERWRKENGGIYTIDYELKSAIPWTPPTLAVYPFQEYNFNNFNYKSAYNLTAYNGELIENSLDANVLRLNGYAMRMRGDATSTGLLGAEVSATFARTTEKNNIGLFFQFMATDILLDDSILTLAGLYRGTKTFAAQLKEYEGSNKFYGYIVDANDSTSYVYGSIDGSFDYHTIRINTWYDACFTYDGVNQRNELYVCPSATSTFTNFLDGTTNLNQQTAQYGNTTFIPIDKQWTKLSLLKEESAGVIDTKDYVYLQNLFVFDGFVTAYDFNMLRRLCWLWNKKTTTYPK